MALEFFEEKDGKKALKQDNTDYELILIDAT